jgi:hypothetical protein
VTRTFALDLAGVTVAVEVAEPSWYPSLVSRYAAFATTGAPSWTVRLDWDPALEVTDWPVVEHTEHTTHFRVMSYRGWVDLARRQGTVYAPAAERAASAIERVLVYVLMQMLPREHDGLLLHGVGVAWHGEGHLFFGPSGAGKTTLAQRAAGHAQVLCDENVVACLSQQGPKLCSTPFWGHSTPPDLIERTNRRVPLRAMYALEQTEDFSLQRLSPGQAVVALSLTEKVAAERTSSAAAWLAVAEHLVQRVPVYRLGVALRPGFWEFLAESTAAKQLT